MELKKPIGIKSLKTLIRAVLVTSFALFLFFSATNITDRNEVQAVSAAELNGVTAGVTRAITPNLAEISASSSDNNLVTTGAALFSDFAIVELATEVVSVEPEVTEEPDELSEEVLRQNEDVLLLARLIEGEAGSINSIDERAAVGMTVLWRTDSSRWPNSIYENIYKPYQYEAAPTVDAYYSEDSMQAAIKAYTYWKTDRGEEILPSEYMSFFGYAGHNWFYDRELTIYEFPGVSTPGNIYEAMTEVIPALRRAAGLPDPETEVAETSETTEEPDIEGSVLEPEQNPDDTEQLTMETPTEVL